MLLAVAQGISLARRLHTPIELRLYQCGIFQQSNNLAPDELVQIVLAHRTIVAQRSTQMPIGIGTEAAIVIERALGSARRGPIPPVATLLADQQSLKYGRLDCASRSKPAVSFQLLLCHLEGLVTDQCRDGNLDPLLAWPLVVG